jgi:hypothetical protein
MNTINQKAQQAVLLVNDTQDHPYSAKKGAG